MTSTLTGAVNALGAVASWTLQPIIPASALAIMRFGPTNILNLVLSPKLLARLFGSRSASDFRLPLQIALGLGLARAFNRAASSWALTNWQISPRSDWRWNSEVAVVTGGCGGIGKAIVLGLAEKGVMVAILDVQEFPEDLKQSSRVKYWNCDIASSSAIKQVAEEIRESLGHPSILINNAGISLPHTILDTSEDQLKKLFDVNILSHWTTVQEFLPEMIEKNKGHVVTVASTASYSGLPTQVPYSATKSGLLSFHEGLAGEIKHVYEAPGILTTIVQPMWVRTGMTSKPGEGIRANRRNMMDPEDVSGPVLERIFCRRGGHLIIPESSSWVSAIRSLPSWLQEFLRDSVSKAAKKAH